MSMSILVFNVGILWIEIKINLSRTDDNEVILVCGHANGLCPGERQPSHVWKVGSPFAIDFNIPDHKCTCSLDLPLNECIFLIPYLINDINYFYMSLFCIYWRIQFYFFFLKISLTAYGFVCSTWLPLKSLAMNICLFPVRLFTLKCLCYPVFPTELKTLYLE